MLGRLTKVLTRLLLAATLVGATAAASLASASLASPRGNRAECPMGRSHGCCKKSRRNSRATSAAPAARLCCVANFPQPAPAGGSFTLRPSCDAASTPHPHATPSPALPAAEHARAYAPPFQPSHSPPAYIQHAAFLI